MKYFFLIISLLLSTALISQKTTWNHNGKVQIKSDGSMVVDSSTLVIDGTYGRVGIGVADPGSYDSEVLDVVGGRIRLRGYGSGVYNPNNLGPVTTILGLNGAGQLIDVTQFDFIPGYTSFSTDNIFWKDNGGGGIYYNSGNVAIGLSDAVSKLGVSGGTAIGSGYAGSYTAPTNGLLVEGNVGIGTTIPNSRLDIGGATPTFTMSDNGSIGFKILDFSDNSQYLDFSGNLYFRNGIDGVGNTSPLSLLSDGGVYVRNSYFRQDAIEIGASLTGDRYSYIDLHADDTYTDYSYRILRDPGANGIVYAAQRGTGSVNFYNVESAPFDFYTNSTHRMRIGADGNVGIGTTSPSQKLDVVGQIQATSRISAGIGTGSVAMTLNDGYGNANLTFNHLGGKADVTGNAGRIEVNVDATTNSAMSFELKDNLTAGVATSLNEVMILYGDGKVKMSDYGVGANVGTATYSLAVDASGNVIEEPLSGSNTWYDVTYGTNTGNGGYADLQCMCNADGQVFFKGTHVATATVSGGNPLMTLPTQCRPNRVFHTNHIVTNISTGNPINVYFIKINTNGVVSTAFPFGANYSINMHTLTYNKNL